MGWHKKDKQKFIRPSIILVSSFLLIGFMVFSGVSFIARAQDNKETEAAPFYKCVIDSLNSEEINRKSDRKYSHKVTDAELSKLNKFECNYYSGYMDDSLLQKMVNLKEVSLGGDGSFLNFSSNSKLEKIVLHGSNILGLNLSKNIELKSLEVIYNYFLEITDLDLTANTKLERLVLGVRNLAELDISKNIELKVLEINYAEMVGIDNKLKEINLTNNQKLEKIVLDSTINSINFSKNINLKDLFIRADNLSSLDLSANKKLKSLSLVNSLFKSLDLSQNKELTSFSQFGGNLTIDFSQIPKLKEVNLGGVFFSGGTVAGCRYGSNYEDQDDNYRKKAIASLPVLAGYKQLDFSNNPKLQKFFYRICK